MKQKYRVTLFVSDGSQPQYTTWAETPEAAVNKIKKRISAFVTSRGLTVAEGWAELLKQEKESGSKRT